MPIAGQLFASGPGWRVDDFVCTAGPHDRPFEERHQWASIAIVTDGTFQYRSSLGSAVLGPGALMLGNQGTCYECGHEHAAGDRCLSFQFAPDYVETVLGDVRGGSRSGFAHPCLPPLPALIPVIAAAEVGRDERDPAALEEAAFRLLGAAVISLGAAPQVSPTRRRDERRITDALRRIESAAEEPLSLLGLARDAAMSPYHFLRTFRAVVGMTPYQYLLRTRLHRAALRLRRTRAPVSAIAYDAGFNDLSTFNRRFRAIMGVSPTAYRSAR